MHNQNQIRIATNDKQKTTHSSARRAAKIFDFCEHLFVLFDFRTTFLRLYYICVTAVKSTAIFYKFSTKK